MPGQPELIDNQDRYTHRDALTWLAEHRSVPLSVASGYVAMAGLVDLAVLRNEHGDRRVRLLIGATPEAGLGLDDDSDRRRVRDAFEASLRALRTERDFDAFPDSRREQTIGRVRDLLLREDVEVKRYVGRFLHGKAYLFAEPDEEQPAGDGAAVVTSANLTHGGLVGNLELGVANYQPGTLEMARSWFNELWGQAESFKEQLIELLYPEERLYDPETVFLRALWELYGDEVEDLIDAEAPTKGLISFQRDGYLRAKRIVEKYGGVLYADGVGSGKTEIGLEFVRRYTKELGQHALVIVPAQMKKNVWQPRIHTEMLPAEVISYQQLAMDRQLSARPGAERVLAVHKDAYRLVLIDEAHAFRNQDTHWYECLDRLLGGAAKHLVMLTATPVNNGLWDLYNLMMLFARHDAAFAGEPLGIPSLRKRFIAAGAADLEAISEEKLFPLMNELAVRRDRGFLMRHYPNATFPDGTPVRFPTPRLTSVRYDLDSVCEGVFAEIVDAIGRLTMARYRPSAYALSDAPTEEAADERVLAGLIQSGLLKRFESSSAAAHKTVRAMMAAHDVLIEAWDNQGSVPSVAALRQLVLDLADGEPLSAVVQAALDGSLETLPTSAFSDRYIEDVRADRALLGQVAARLHELRRLPDPKLERLAETLRATSARKVVVFSTFGDTVEYVTDAIARDPARFGGRSFVSIVGGNDDADTRVRKLERFCPQSVDDYEGMAPLSPSDEVDLLISTDVVSEGQNLQEAQAVISYDMPWNPQRVVQRNGRIIRLKSPHEEVFLYTLLPEPGGLEEVLKLEAKVRAKIAAANAAVGMESQVLDDVEAESRVFADALDELEDLATRIAEGDESLLDEGEAAGSSTFVAEEFRARLRRLADEGEIDRIRNLPWGIGATVVKPGVTPGVFFAARSRAGERWWRFVPDEGDLVVDDLEMLRRIDPEACSAGERVRDLEAAWRLAAADICREHNERLDPRYAEQRLPASQRWALEQILRHPELPRDPRYGVADGALSVGRDQLVMRGLSEVRAALQREEIGLVAAADAIVEVVERYGLRPTERPKRSTKPLSYDDLGVVCWMEVVSQ